MRERLLQLRVFNVDTLRISTKYKVIVSDELLSDVITHTNFLPEQATLYERLYCIIRNISSTRVCPVCQKDILFSIGKKQYATYCRGCAIKTPEVRSKYNETMMDRYQTQVPIHNADIKQRISDTIQRVHGANWFTQTPEIKQSQLVNGVNRSTASISHAAEYVNDPSWLKGINLTKSISSISELVRVSPSLIQKRMKDFNLTPVRHYCSKVEQEIADYVASTIGYDPVIRSKVCGVEIDILIPSHGLGIEVDGIYWHSELKGKHKNYHNNKTELCRTQNIQLLHITDRDWIYYQDIVKSRINSHLGCTTRIFARKCKCRSLTKSERRLFFNNNHIQQDTGANISYGLFYNDVLVSAASFGVPRFSKTCDFELIRSCTLLNHTVVGGMSKLLQFFIKDQALQDGTIIISYADKKWGRGGVYEKCGMQYVRDTVPNYLYFTPSSIYELKSRQQFQKHKLSTKLKSFDPNKTEWENMVDNGYDRIWDCGNVLWEYVVHTP